MPVSRAPACTLWPRRTRPSSLVRIALPPRWPLIQDSRITWTTPSPTRPNPARFPGSLAPIDPSRSPKSYPSSPPIRPAPLTFGPGRMSTRRSHRWQSASGQNAGSTGRDTSSRPRDPATGESCASTSTRSGIGSRSPPSAIATSRPGSPNVARGVNLPRVGKPEHRYLTQGPHGRTRAPYPAPRRCPDGSWCCPSDAPVMPQPNSAGNAEGPLPASPQVRTSSHKRTPDGIRTRATALRGRRARPLHNGGLAH